MDLKIKDVAELLNVSVSTIRRWLQEGRIPAYRLNHQYRFSRQEIEDWVMQQRTSVIQLAHATPDIGLEEEAAAAPQGTHHFVLYRAINHGGVHHTIAGTTKEEIIRNTTEVLAEKFGLDAEVLTDLLLDRERLMSTGIGNGIAIPHTRDFLLERHFDIVAIVFPEKPIEYGALDGLPVSTLFFLFASDAKRHLHLLSKIAHLCHSPEGLALLQRRPQREELMHFIQTWEHALTQSTQLQPA